MGITDGLAKIIDSEIVRNLLGPATKNAGLLGGTLTDILVFYSNRNLGNIFTEWARQRGYKPLEPADIPKVMPLLHAASLVSDEELQKRWAALLESTVTDEDVLPSFGQTLSQLTADEAKYLECLYRQSGSFGLGDIKRLTDIYEPSLRTTLFEDHEQFREKEKYIHLLIRDFERLGLLAVEHSVEEIRPYIRSYDDVIPLLEKLCAQKLKGEYRFSAYGERFIKAVTPKA
jgi:hypothetical protein